MDYLAIPTAPLQIILDFIQVDSSPPQPHPVAGQAGTAVSTRRPKSLAWQAGLVGLCGVHLGQT